MTSLFENVEVENQPTEKCPVCGDFLLNRSLLLDHYRTKHKVKKDKLIKCVLCGASVKRLDVHLKNSHATEVQHQNADGVTSVHRRMKNAAITLRIDQEKDSVHDIESFMLLHREKISTFIRSTIEEEKVTSKINFNAKCLYSHESSEGERTFQEQFVSTTYKELLPNVNLIESFVQETSELLNLKVYDVESELGVSSNVLENILQININVLRLTPL